MLAFHRRIAEIALPVSEPFGFVLAGGYAISENGIGERPSSDVDLFTVVNDPTLFATAVEAVRSSLHNSGFTVVDNRTGPTFADMHVLDPQSGESSDMQLGVNYRQFPPARLSIGPVLDVRDAVAGKMSALWSRGLARDFMDIDAVIQSGRFTREDVLAMGDAQEVLPMDRHMLADRFRMAHAFTYDYEAYGLTPGQSSGMVARYMEWADLIDPDSSPDEAPSIEIDTMEMGGEWMGNPSSFLPPGTDGPCL